MVYRTLEPRAESAYDHVVAEIRRVSRTVKGGRRFRFRAAVMIGDRHGHVGFALQKGKDVQAAVEKARVAARKSLVRIMLQGSTIPYAVRAHYGGAGVLLKPAPPGAGVIAGGPIRALASLAGIQDLSSKCIGSRNKVNVIRAALKALGQLHGRESSSGERAAGLQESLEHAHTLKENEGGGKP